MSLDMFLNSQSILHSPLLDITIEVIYSQPPYSAFETKMRRLLLRLFAIHASEICYINVLQEFATLSVSHAAPRTFRPVPTAVVTLRGSSNGSAITMTDLINPACILQDSCVTEMRV